MIPGKQYGVIKKRTDNKTGVKLLLMLIILSTVTVFGTRTLAFADDGEQTGVITESPEETKGKEEPNIPSLSWDKEQAKENGLDYILSHDGISKSEMGAVAEKVLSTCLKYIPFLGLGVFVLGMFIALLFLSNKGKKRWGLRMAIVTSLMLYLVYIALAVLYDYSFNDEPLKELVRPENLDFYGSVYFDTMDRIIQSEKLAGLTENYLSKDVINLLVEFYKNSAVNVAIAVFGLSFLLAILAKGNPPLRRWARTLYVLVPLILYLGYWYLGQL